MDYRKAKKSFEDKGTQIIIVDVVSKMGGQIGSKDLARELVDRTEDIDFVTAQFIINLSYSQKTGAILSEHEYLTPDGDVEKGFGFSPLDAALNDGLTYPETEEGQRKASETPRKPVFA